MRGTTFLMAEKIIRMFIGFFVSVLFARHLGPTQLGYFTFIIAFSAIFSPVILLGGEDYSLKYLREKQSDTAVVYIFWQRILVNILVSLLICIFFYFSQTYEVFVWGSVYMAFNLFRPFETIADELIYEGRTEAVSYSRFFGFCCSTALKIFGIYKKFSWEFFIFVAGLEILVILFFTLYFSRRKLGQLFRFPQLFLESIKFREAFGIMVLGVSTIAITKIDHIMIELIKGSHELGNYAAVSKLFDVSLFVPASFLTVAYPIILSSRTPLVNQSVYSIIAVMSLALFAIMFSFGDLIVRSLYGASFQGAAEIVSIYSSLVFFTFFSLARVKTFIANGHVKTYSALVLTTAIMDILFNFIFIKEHGARGAIWSTILAYIASNLVFIFISPHVRSDMVTILKSFILLFQPKVVIDNLTIRKTGD